MKRVTEGKVAGGRPGDGDVGGWMPRAGAIGRLASLLQPSRWGDGPWLAHHRQSSV